MRWRWRRAAAEAAARGRQDAQEQLEAAQARAAHVESTTRKARALKRTADRFTAEFERSMHLRGQA